MSRSFWCWNRAPFSIPAWRGSSEFVWLRGVSFDNPVIVSGSGIKENRKLVFLVFFHRFGLAGRKQVGLRVYSCYGLWMDGLMGWESSCSTFTWEETHLAGMMGKYNLGPCLWPCCRDLVAPTFDQGVLM